MKKANRSDYGNKIASRNAYRHGLKTINPHVLVNEDKAEYDGLLEGLMEDYQPTNTTQTLIVEKIAMGFWRLKRCWAVETARINKEILDDRKRDYSGNDFRCLAKTIDEIEVLEKLNLDLSYDLDPKQLESRSQKETLKNLAESLNNSSLFLVKKCVYELVKESQEWLRTCTPDDAGLAIEKSFKILHAVKQRLTVAQKEKAEFAAIYEKTISIKIDPTLLSRYERGINRQLKEDIELLLSLQNRG
jgi:hypothetical protein